MTKCPESGQGSVRYQGTPGPFLREYPIDNSIGRIPERRIATRWTRKREPFLKGPITWSIVEQLSGQALKVYLAIRHRADLAAGDTAVLTNDYLQACGVPRSTKSDALRILEDKGLVAVDRRRGRAVRVTVLRR